MGIRFSADELLAIAEQIERNGVAFYAAAATAVTADSAGLLSRLSEWEAGHADLFAAMRQGLAPREREATAYDPDNEIALYLGAMADGAIFPTEEDPAAVLGPNPTFVRIYALALEREQTSIVFYTGMRDFLPPALGRDKLEQVIREEFGHIALLQHERAQRTR